MVTRTGSVEAAAMDDEAKLARSADCPPTARRAAEENADRERANMVNSAIHLASASVLLVRERLGRELCSVIFLAHARTGRADKL
jgi:hypothetical protein